MREKIPSPLFPRYELAVVAGVGALAAAAFCFHDAWEARGKERPWWGRWLLV
jgi:hypothetical protein